MTDIIESSTNIQELPLLPLKNVVILPKSILPIVVGRPSSILAVEYALKQDNKIFITSQKNSEIEYPGQGDLFEYGTKSTILQVMRMPKGHLKILVEGISRAKVVSSRLEGDILKASIESLHTIGLENRLELDALWRQLTKLYMSYCQLNPKTPIELLDSVKDAEDMDVLADTLAVHLNLSFDERQKLLETTSLPERLLSLCGSLKHEIDVIETEERIRTNISKQVEKNQKEYYLTEQIKAIQKELGREDTHTEAQQLRLKIKTLGLTAEAHDQVTKELKRLEQMPPFSAEAVVSRNYIDWIVSLPWHKRTRDSISLEQAEKILEKNHAGLKQAKERIIEFLAAKKFSKSLERSPIICLIGPPGVGKTSLAKSIADSLGREFVRISLGGVKDEAEIRGHRRTYVGAMPGKIIQAMRKAKTENPVILLDEIDKMANDIHGDPSSALLEVLDPEQNKTFVDHFLEIEYDLSKVMFITTANVAEGIPYPLWDRMERILISGYTEDEKVNIANSFLLPKNLKEYGLKSKQFKLASGILDTIVTRYTKEAGVRQLERSIAKLIRKSIQLLLKEPNLKSVTVTEQLLKDWLGNPSFKPTSLELSNNRIGLATGLAWTEVGGDVLEIETTVLPGKGGLTLTGQLGEVMQESAHAALSYIRSRAVPLGLKESFYSNKDIHIHIPEGATPKDGPSAGITICLALVSALKGIPTKIGVAMTGEITLRGRVLAIGGLKAKILAAKQHEIKTLIVPEENHDDMDEIIKDVGQLDNLTIIFVDNMDDVLKYALVENPFEKPIAEVIDKEDKKVKKSNFAKKTKKE